MITKECSSIGISVIGVSVNKEFWCEWGVCVVGGWMGRWGWVDYGYGTDGMNGGWYECWLVLSNRAL